MTEAELAQLNEAVGHLYAAFTAKVAKGRHLSAEQAEAVAKGRVWSGLAAKERGLVDEIGGLSTAVAIARETARISPSDRRHQLVTYRAERRWLDFRGSSADVSTPWATRARLASLGIPSSMGAGDARDARARRRDAALSVHRAVARAITAGSAAVLRGSSTSSGAPR